MSQLQYAVQVNLSTYTGNLIQAGIGYDATLGHSVMRVITGRPGYDGTQAGITYEDTSSNTDVWYEDLLIVNGLSNPSKRVDLEDTGDYGTLSGFNFTLNNAIVAGTDTPFADLFLNNSVWFTGQTVKAWCIIDGVFYQI